MTRTMKALGPTLMAVLALGAVMASAAQANYHTAGAVNDVHAVGPIAEGNHFTITTRTGGKLNVACEEHTLKITHESTGESTTSELTGHPTYTKCSIAGLESTVT